MGRGFGPRRSGRKDLVMAAAKRSLTAPVQELVERAIEELMASLPDPDQLSPAEQEYTDVHGVVDVVHTEGLFRALEAEVRLGPEAPEPARLLTGMEMLRTLIEAVVHPHVATAAPVEHATDAVDPLVIQEAA